MPQVTVPDELAFGLSWDADRTAEVSPVGVFDEVTAGG
jgi:hypothetical protein